MAEAITIAEAIAVLKADRSQLTEGLEEALDDVESYAKSAQSVMESGASRMSASTASTSGALNSFAIQSSITKTAVKELGRELGLGFESMQALSRAAQVAMKFLSGPVGIVAALAVGLVAYRKEIAGVIVDWQNWIGTGKTLTATLAELDAVTLKNNASLRERATAMSQAEVLVGLQDELAVVRGEMSKFDAMRAAASRRATVVAMEGRPQTYEQEAELKIAIEIEKENKRQLATVDQAVAKRTEIRQSLMQEIAILEGTATKYDYIRDSLERERTIRRDVLGLEKEINREYDARRERIAAQERSRESRQRGEALRMLIAGGFAKESEHETGIDRVLAQIQESQGMKLPERGRGALIDVGSMGLGALTSVGANDNLERLVKLSTEQVTELRLIVSHTENAPSLAITN